MRRRGDDGGEAKEPKANARNENGSPDPTRCEREAARGSGSPSGSSGARTSAESTRVSASPSWRQQGRFIIGPEAPGVAPKVRFEAKTRDQATGRASRVQVDIDANENETVRREVTGERASDRVDRHLANRRRLPGRSLATAIGTLTRNNAANFATPARPRQLVIARRRRSERRLAAATAMTGRLPSRRPRKCFTGSMTSRSPHCAPTPRAGSSWSAGPEPRSPANTKLERFSDNDGW